MLFTSDRTQKDKYDPARVLNLECKNIFTI